MPAGQCLNCRQVLSSSAPFAWCQSCQAVTVVAEPGYAARRDWADLAACKGRTEVFYTDGDGDGRGDIHVYDEAKAICAGCPVRPECLADWLDMPSALQHYGVRATLSPRSLIGAVRTARRHAARAA